MLDLVIRGGTVIDGSGAPRVSADVGIRDGLIAEVGRISERGRREIDASGLLLTPGLVDVHTHFDGQVTWEPLLSPSCWLGVTTVVMGNCGVGFAPVRPGDRDYLISLMEGVEDIPGTALAEGIRWEWESFPEYLDAIGRRRLALDVGAQVPHGALRVYVMGHRGADHTVAPDEREIESMGRLAREAIDAGALGFSSSRTTNHRAKDGSLTPSLTAGLPELLGIARALRGAGRGVFEIVCDFRNLDEEFELLRQMVQVSGRPMSISVAQSDLAPEQWRQLLDRIGRAVGEGLPMKAQVAARAIGIMLGLRATFNPFAANPSFREIADKDHGDKLRIMRDPEFRRRLLAEKPEGMGAFLLQGFDRMFVLGDPPDYEPDPEQSIAARAARRGIAPAELAYELLLEDEGEALLYRPLLNYGSRDLECVREMLLDPNTVPGLGDAGAHCGLICDGSFPAFLLLHWARDRARGPQLPLEWLVRRQTADTAALVGLHDRGLIAPGFRADLNLIDWDHLRLRHPRIVHDLPAGGRRLIQKADGFRMTLCRGEITFEDGEFTGALPGRLVRGPQGDAKRFGRALG